MAAFITFVRAFAVWIYLFLIFGILLGIKMLVDAQRLARTTLFSLDQERAGEQTFRGLTMIVVFLLGMFLVTVIILLSPFAPAQDPTLGRSATATLPAFVFASSTPAPSATFTPLPRTETPFFTATPIIATATRTVTRPPLTLAQPSATPVYALSAPKIIGPLPNGGTWTGEGQATAAMTLRWTCDKCVLGSNDWYEIVISYTDKTGAPRTVVGRTQETFIPLRRIYEGGGFELYHQAKEDTFFWFVQVKREPGNQPLSPPSETWKFIWH